MTHNQRRPDQTETAMGDAWEALVLGEVAEDPETMAVVREVLEDLAALEQEPPLSFAHRARIWQEVLAAATIATTAHPPVTLPASYPASPNGHRPVMTLPVAPLPTRRSRLVASLSMTVLVVLGLAAVLLVAMGGLQRGAIRVGDLTILPAIADEVPALIPAIDGTLTTPQTGTTDTLLDTKVTALPEGRLRVAVDRWTLQPSPSAVRLSTQEGVVVLAVDVGQVTVTVDGADHELGGGEALEVTSTEFAFHNAGTGEATAYVAYAIPHFSAELGHGAMAKPWLDGDPLFHTHDVLISSVAEQVPPGSGRLVLERLTVSPGVALPAETASPWIWTRASAGTLGLSLTGESLPRGWESGAEHEFLPHFQNLLPVVAPGTTMVMRNAGDDPLVLYRLTLEPSGKGELSS